MQFASPWMLLGLGLCLVPVLIHLLSRRQYRRETWAAMRFLRAALERRAQQMRLEALLLLIVRTLLVGVVVLALAEPLFRTSAVSSGRPPVHYVLVVDASASMGRSDGRQRASDRAREELQQLLEAAQPGDAFHLVRIAAAPPWVLIRQATFDPDEVQIELDRGGLTAERGDVAAALQAAVDLVQQLPAPEAKEVVIVTDLQRSNWLPPEAAVRARLQGLLRELARRGALKFIDVGGRSLGNLAVTALEPSRLLAAPGQRLSVQGRFKNFGAAKVAGRVEWLVNGRLVEVAPFEVDGDGESTVQVTFEVPERPTCEVEARLALEDELAVDNRRFLSVPVRGALRTLLVEGRPALRPMAGGSDFLRAALSPLLTADAAVPRRLIITPLVCLESDLPQTNLQDVDCVWLCDVPQLEGNQRHRLVEYVERGGGLIVSMGDQVDPAAYNAWTTSTGERFWPGELEGVQDLADGEPPYVTFDVTEPVHPILKPFQGNPEGGLATTLVRRYLRCREVEAGGGRVVARFSNGDPAILERRVGLGRVLMVLTSADDRWGTWAVWPSFLPLVHELVQYASLGRLAPGEWTVGSRVERELSAGEFDVEATLTTPGGVRRSLPVRCDDRTCRVVVAETAEPGFYRLDYGPPRNSSESLAFNVDPEESPPGRLTEADVTAQLLPRARFTYQTEWLGQGPLAPAAGATGSLAGTLLTVALVLMVMELLLAWRSRWGLAALAAAGVAAALWPAWEHNPRLALAWAVLIAAAAVMLGDRLRPRLVPRRSADLSGGKK